MRRVFCWTDTPLNLTPWSLSAGGLNAFLFLSMGFLIELADQLNQEQLRAAKSFYKKPLI